MSSSRKKKAAMQQRLQQLRAIPDSSTMNKASIVVDASKYIKEVKKTGTTPNKDIGTSQMSIDGDRLPAVVVETLEKGFLINVFSDTNCPGLLVSILEAFENLGLDVLDARVSCTDNFQLEVVGEESENSIDAQVVKEAVLQAIMNRSEQD